MALTTTRINDQRVYVDDATPGTPLDGTSGLISGTGGKLAADAAANISQTGIGTLATAGRNVETELDDNALAIGNNATAASDAQSDADAAQSTANDAATAASNAQGTADGAVTAAGNAQSAADNAQGTADDAATAASDAQGTADGAVTAAGNAQSAADAAQLTANTANDKADDNASDIDALENANLMNWNGAYVSGQSVLKNATVRSEQWTMIANKDTSDPAAPQSVGDVVDIYQGTMSNATEQATYISWGQRYYFDADVWIRGWRVYTFAGQRYEIYRVLDPEGTPDVAGVAAFTATTTGWRQFEVQGILLTGTTMDVLCRVTQPDPAADTWSGSWDYDTPNNFSAPASGVCQHATNATGSLRFHKTDASLVDQSANLLGLSSGDAIDAVGQRWTVVSATDQGTWVDVAVLPSQQGSPDGVATFNFETVDQGPIEYVSDLGYWDTTSFASQVDGVYQIEAGTAVVDRNAYGIDLSIQGLVISADWDVVATPSTNAIGTGGGDPGDSGVLAAFTDAESIGLVEGDKTAADENSRLINEWLDSQNFDAQNELQFKAGQWWFSDTIRFSRTGGGPWLRGAGGIGGAYPQDDYVPSSNDSSPWAGPRTQFNWIGAKKGATGVPFIDIRGRGQAVRGIHIEGAPLDTGTTTQLNAQDSLDVGPLVGVYISDDWTGHGTGYNPVEDVTFSRCQIGVQLGSRKTFRLTQASSFGANNTITVKDHNYHNGAIIIFEPAGSSPGTLPPGLAVDTNYWVVNPTRDTFQLAPFDPNNMPLPTDPDYLTNIVQFTSNGGTNGRIEIYRNRTSAEPGLIWYSNSDQFTAENITFNRVHTGVLVYNGNSIGNKMGKAYWNHCRVCVAIYSGDMLVEVADCNGMYPFASGDSSHWTFFQNRNDGFSGNSQSVGLNVTWIRLDGALGSGGADSCLLVDGRQAVNTYTDAYPTINTFPQPLTFGEVVRSNEHTVGYQFQTIAYLYGATKLTINKIRGLSENHFVVKAGDYIGTNNAPYYGPDDVTWRPTIRVNNADFFALPGASDGVPGDPTADLGPILLAPWAAYTGDPITDDPADLLTDNPPTFSEATVIVTNATAYSGELIQDSTATGIANAITTIGLRVATSATDNSAAAHNTATLNAWLSKDKNVYQINKIYFPPGAYYFADTITFPRVQGGIVLEGAGGVNYGWTEPEYWQQPTPGDPRARPFTGPVTRFIWDGDVGDTNKSFIEMPGFGSVIRDIMLVGHYETSGAVSKPEYAQRDPRVYGPYTAINFLDNQVSFSEGRHAFDNVTVFGCRNAIQFGSIISHDDLPASSVFDIAGNQLFVADGHTWANGTEFRFTGEKGVSTGTFPSASDDQGAFTLTSSTPLYVISGGFETFKFARDRDASRGTVTLSGSASGTFQLGQWANEIGTSPSQSNSDMISVGCFHAHSCWVALALFNTSSIGNYVRQLVCERTATACYIHRGDMHIGNVDANEIPPAADVFRLVEYGHQQQSGDFIIDNFRIDNSIDTEWMVVDMSKTYDVDNGNTNSRNLIRVTRGKRGFNGQGQAVPNPGEVGVLCGNTRLHLCNWDDLFPQMITTSGFTWAEPGGEVPPNPAPDNQIGPSIFLDDCRFNQPVDPSDVATSIVRNASNGSKPGSAVTVTMVGCCDFYGNILVPGGISQERYIIS